MSCTAAQVVNSALAAARMDITTVMTSSTTLSLALPGGGGPANGPNRVWSTVA